MSDLDGLCFTRRGQALVPSDIHADEWLSGVKEGREVILTGRKARSPAHHRWFFAMLRIARENLEGFPSEDALLDALKHSVGLTDVRMMLDGTPYLVTRSISFAAMDQDKFRRFVDRCLYVLGQRLGVSPEQLMKETDDRQGGWYRRTYKGRVGSDGYDYS